ncbi:hypothetical protein [Streptomyces sp. NRRL S-448]|uniref:hypothetical protein n=1 Tax=Streptomyces sp. NRRL S-448 TaxID=1463907 RepID=UPI003567138D
MDANIATLAASLIGMVSTALVASAGMRQTKVTAQSAVHQSQVAAEAAMKQAQLTTEAAVEQAQLTAKAAVEQAQETAGGPSHLAATQRNAEFQSRRRELYGVIMEHLVDFEYNMDESSAKAQGDLMRAVRKGQVVAREPLRGKLNVLANGLGSFDGDALNDLARAMYEDAKE